MDKLQNLFAHVVELVVPYLEALGTTKTDSGEWPANAIIAWSPQDSGIESLGSYVAKALSTAENVVSTAFAEQLIVTAALANPDRFRLSYMRTKRNEAGVSGLRENEGMPVATISLKRGGGTLKPFVPGATSFVKKVNDATIVG